ncbi:hypothetical protein WICPIJ_009143 [Wickerhamomyces pijperi]|uniref:Uncharacterized protein n=1 Tax=Wickerhamomyces pijperi TaxID=599730 RepID=A0A9P8PQ36_WICPI|nr:hypothetical protein WICPIJ_009143 [Wickerhamomyces pijperi]
MVTSLKEVLMLADSCVAMCFASANVFEERTALINDFNEDIALDRSSWKPKGIECVGQNKSVDHDRLGLPDSVHPVHSLKIHLWVPVVIEQDNAVGLCQVQPKTTSSGRQQEDLDVRISVEPGDLLFSVLLIGATVQSRAFVAAEFTPVLNKIQSLGELTEDQNLVVLLQQSWDQLVDHLQLTGRGQQLLKGHRVLVIPREIEENRVEILNQGFLDGGLNQLLCLCVLGALRYVRQRAKVKPFLEQIQVVEDIWKNEVQQGPQLGKIVLQGSTGKQQSVAGSQSLQLSDQQTVHVLQSMALIHDQELPVNRVEVLDIPQDSFITGDDNSLLNSVLVEELASQLGPFILCPQVLQHSDVRSESLELLVPVPHRGQRSSDQEITINPLFVEKGQQGNRLDGLTETHLIRQDTVQPVLIKRDQPFSTLQLVVSHSTTGDQGRLLDG